MRIRRLTVRLPAALRATAQSETRAIAEAVGRELAKSASETPGPTRVTIARNGQHGAVLGAQVAAGIASPSKGGTHGR